MNEDRPMLPATWVYLLFSIMFLALPKNGTLFC